MGRAPPWLAGATVELANPCAPAGAPASLSMPLPAFLAAAGPSSSGSHGAEGLLRALDAGGGRALVTAVEMPAPQVRTRGLGLGLYPRPGPPPRGHQHHRGQIDQCMQSIECIPNLSLIMPVLELPAPYPPNVANVAKNGPPCGCLCQCGVRKMC